MQRYETAAPAQAEAALDRLGMNAAAPRVTHLILASCTGFAAPGLDHCIVKRYGICGSVERSVIGLMGCQAAIDAPKLAWHIMRSDSDARVAVVCLELCALHLQESSAIQGLLAFLIFADGGATALVTSEPGGFRVDGFYTAGVRQASDQITWRIGDTGFVMTLSDALPLTPAHALPACSNAILGGVHPFAMPPLFAAHGR